MTSDLESRRAAVSAERIVFTDAERRITAAHEAGHAAACAALAIPLASAHCFRTSADDPDSFQGRVYLEMDPDEFRAEVPPVDAIAMLAASGIAVRRLTGQHQSQSSYGDDASKIKAIAARCGHRAEAVTREGWQKAANITDWNHKRIEKLAAMLFDNADVTGAEVLAMFPERERGRFASAR